VEKSCIASLEPIPTIKGELVHFFCIFGFWGVWSAIPKRSDRFWPRVGGLCPELALVQGEFAYVQGEFFYALVVWVLCLSMFLSRLC
jgi:hypothetical protein